MIVVEDYNKLKSYCFDSWFTTIFNLNNGLWIGRGIVDQNLLRLSTMTKEMTKDYKNKIYNQIPINTNELELKNLSSFHFYFSMPKCSYVFSVTTLPLAVLFKYPC